MKTILNNINKITGALLATSLLLAGSLTAAPQEFKTEAPYMETDSSEPQSTFPLLSTKVDATLTDGIVKATVTQVYKNTHTTPIEATYTFPLSTRAAVHAMEMQIGDRTIKAKIKEKQDAKAIYQKAKAEKKATSLLEQKRPNVFQTKVANILPGETIEVQITFSELLIPEDNTYEWIFPTVVGPRYAGDTTQASPDSGTLEWVNTPYYDPTNKSTAPQEPHFSINATVNTSLTFQAFQCPSHQPTINHLAPNQTTVSLDSSATGYQANRDFILRFRLADEKIVSGITTHQGADENFFLINVQPPARVTPAHIPPREYLFVIDVSGSMTGFPLKTAKKLFLNLGNNLRPIDQFNIQFFAGTTQLLSPHPIPATRANIQNAFDKMNQHNGSGGTELNSALKKALSMTSNTDLSRNIVIITDGYISEDPQTFEIIRSHRGTANIYSFGIGSSVNRHLIEGIAKVGGGEPFIVTQPQEAEAVAAKFAEYISSPVLTNITINSEDIHLTEVQPSGLNDLFANRALVVTGKWKTKGPQYGKITITGKTGSDETFSQTFTIDTKSEKQTGKQSKKQNPVIRDLWARETVRELIDFNTFSASADLKQRITNLGLEYQLLTPYTSFVAVDETPRDFTGNAKSVTQPLPLPAGVSMNALSPAQSMKNGSIPEPSSTLLFIISAFACLLVRNRN
ncbi:MAG: VIT domain-containing protein [Akkermansiaceae bacterium]